MGSRGPLAKPPGEAQGHREHAELRVLEPRESVRVPAPPEGMSARTVERWRTYWESDVAQLAEEVDIPAIERLFQMYDQWDEAMKIVAKGLAVKGSTGQIRVNPLADHAAKLDGQILRLENEVGLTPMARQRLGIAAGENVLTAAEVNRMVIDAGEVQVVEAAEVLEALAPAGDDPADAG